MNALKKSDHELKSRYRQVTRAGKHNSLHRALAEEAAGRKLSRREHVHHKNDNKLDNRTENLEVKDAGQHSRDHFLKHSITKTCVVCGADFTPHKTKRARNQTCGIKCRGILIGRVLKARSSGKSRT